MKRKIVIIGAGHVGTHCAYSICHQGICNELVLIDVDHKKAVCHAMDIADSLAFMPTPTTVYAGEYSACTDADIVIICAGVPRLPGQTRLDTMGASIRVIQSIIEPLVNSGFSGILLTVSNPADIVANYMRRHTGFPSHKVFGTGTSLDTARLKRVLHEITGFDPRSIQAYSLGEHGDSQMIPFSNITIGGKSFLELIKEQPDRYGAIDLEQILHRTRMIGMDIINGKDSTEFGIGFAVSDMVRAILNDERRIMPVSVLLDGHYGQKNIHAGVPAVIGSSGICEIIDIPMTETEKAMFDHSCSIIREHNMMAEKL